LHIGVATAFGLSLNLFRKITMAVRTGTTSPRRTRKPKVHENPPALLKAERSLKLPHERDETPNATNTSSPVTRQAYRDVTGPQRDTDVRAKAVDVFRSRTGTPAKTGTRVAGTRPARKGARSGRR